MCGLDTSFGTTRWPPSSRRPWIYTTSRDTTSPARCRCRLRHFAPRPVADLQGPSRFEDRRRPYVALQINSKERNGAGDGTRGPKYHGGSRVRLPTRTRRMSGPLGHWFESAVASPERLPDPTSRGSSHGPRAFATSAPYCSTASAAYSATLGRLDEVTRMPNGTRPSRVGYCAADVNLKVLPTSR